ncbi:MAG: hypothetical protein KBS56_05370 [Clostridiales bacterium]|nr:hypothetical protein [Candidatus Crickella equi]
MTSVKKYEKAISEYTNNIKSQSNVALKKAAAMRSLKESGLIGKDGSMKKEIVTR